MPANEPGIPDISPSCQYSMVCGGCDYIGMSYAAALQSKVDEFEKDMLCLQGTHKLPDSISIIPSPNPTYWRTRCQVQIKNGKLGFFRKKSHELIEIEECIMLDKRLNSRLRELKFPEGTNGKIELYIKNGAVCERFVERKYDNLFLQVNESVNDKLIETVIAYLAPQKNDNFLELYCGLGNFTFPISEKSKITAVDLHIPPGKEKNPEFIKADALKGVLDLENKNRLATFNKLLLDPPRAGAGTKLLGELMRETRFERIVYVSCNTASFVKDAEFLLGNSYELKHITLLDMFPFSRYIETANLFSEQRTKDICANSDIRYNGY
jgi:tRNA/tmRNA/rRNA uracil-C5-methylase (TrmA/RlmC/RlmD family)